MGEKVLVVEDSRAFRKYLVQQLTHAGYDVLSAETIEQAQEIFKQSPQLFCAVLDYCLPDGQDGEIIDITLEHGHRVIVMTAMFQANIRERMLAKGVLDYILKDSTYSVFYLVSLLNRLTKNRNHTALIVDDSMVVRRQVSHLLEHQYIKVLEAEDGVSGQEVIEQHPEITLVISDHSMPRKDGITMIRELRARYNKNQLAILGLSASDDSAITAQFLKSGANDFLHKPFNQEEFFCRVHQILDMKEATMELYQMANQDSLTGLWNHRFLHNHACKTCEHYCIALIDVDHFKKINDTFGHDAGDAALVKLAQILKASFPDDTVVRFGGEEFCIQSYSPFDHFIAKLENMREDVSKTPIVHFEKTIIMTISIGVTGIQGSLDEKIKKADDRLYTAKRSGRNQLVAYDINEQDEPKTE